MSKIALTLYFWDCECPDDHLAYIHSFLEDRCKKCGAVRVDQPNSRLNEVRDLHYATLHADRIANQFADKIIRIVVPKNLRED